MSSGRDNTRLGKELAKLEQEDPAVGEAARRLDEAIETILYRGVPRTKFRKSTPDHPCEVIRE